MTREVNVNVYRGLFYLESFRDGVIDEKIAGMDSLFFEKYLIEHSDLVYVSCPELGTKLTDEELRERVLLLNKHQCI